MLDNIARTVKSKVLPILKKPLTKNFIMLGIQVMAFAVLGIRPSFASTNIDDYRLFKSSGKAGKR